MGRENIIITGNTTANNNQFTGGGGFSAPLPTGGGFQYARVVKVNKDRSILYEMIKNNLGISAINGPKSTGLAYNFNPNFTRLPEVGELVPIIKGPTKNIGNKSRMYDETDYYILGPISVQLTVDDNKVPEDTIPLPTNSVNNYRLNEIGINTIQQGQVIPSVTPTPVPPTPAPSETPTPTPTPKPQNPKTPKPLGLNL